MVTKKKEYDPWPSASDSTQDLGNNRIPIRTFRSVENIYFGYSLHCMAELHGKLKRETGNNSSSEAVSPGAKISNKKLNQALTATARTLRRLWPWRKLLFSNLNTRKAYEPRRVNNLVYFRKCSALETALNGIQSDITALQRGIIWGLKSPEVAVRPLKSPWLLLVAQCQTFPHTCSP